MHPLDILEEKISVLHKGVSKLVGESVPGTLNLVLGMEAKSQEGRLKRAVAALSILCDLIPDELSDVELAESLSTGLVRGGVVDAEVVQ